MGFIAPKERKHLSADALFGFVRSLFANVPDHRSDDTDITLTDALMAGWKRNIFMCYGLGGERASFPFLHVLDILIM